MLGDVLLFAPKGTIASQERDLIVTVITLMLIIVVPTLICFFLVAWRYRASNKKAVYRPKTSHGVLRELILWFIPLIIIVILGTITWRTAHALDPYKPIDSSAKPLTIQVVALNWKWLFIYPEQHIATVNYVQLPVGRPVTFNLTADAPMNSFWIPQLGGQMYAMAGMETQLHLMADATGSFPGGAVEINGAGYARMRFIAKATADQDFDAWITSVQQSSPALTQTGYDALVEPSEPSSPSYYGSVPDELFDGIIMKFMVPSMTSSTDMNMPM
jgi:cytochrome o ubiquinol oxidase subunit 2